jgi:hypothetical protein
MDEDGSKADSNGGEEEKKQEDFKNMMSRFKKVYPQL